MWSIGPKHVWVTVIILSSRFIFKPKMIIDSWLTRLPQLNHVHRASQFHSQTISGSWFVALRLHQLSQEFAKWNALSPAVLWSDFGPTSTTVWRGWPGVDGFQHMQMPFLPMEDCISVHTQDQECYVRVEIWLGEPHHLQFLQLFPRMQEVSPIL